MSRSNPRQRTDPCNPLADRNSYAGKRRDFDPVSLRPQRLDVVRPQNRSAYLAEGGQAAIPASSKVTLTPFILHIHTSFSASTLVGGPYFSVIASLHL